MKRLILITSISLALISCTSRQVRLNLEDVESYIMERPDSALAVLEAVCREDLKTERNRAHHALLYAMALDKNYIDVTDDSIARVAVDFYKDHEPKRNYARSLFYLGRCYFYNQEYDMAILEFTKAEKVAKDCDSLYLGMIKTMQARIYNRTYNSIEEINCIRRAQEIFNNIGEYAYLRTVTYSLGIAYHNADRYDEALEIFSELMKNSSSDVDNIYLYSMLSSAHSMVEMENADYCEIDAIFTKAKYEYGMSLEEKDYWAWAYSLYRLGNKADADEMIEGIKVCDELVANFWKLRIAEFFGDYKAVYEYNVATSLHQNKIVEDILVESLASYQSDYYQSQLEQVEYKVQIRTLELITLISVVFLLLVIIYISVSRSIRRHEAEKDKLFEYIEEIKRQLKDVEKSDYSALKRKYLSLYKTRFETIAHLCDQYLQSTNRTDIEALMFKKVESLISEVQKDSSNRVAFESMLDDDLDMIMTRLRSEMPKFKEIDYAIFSYLIVGFDATTISLLLDMTVNNVYAHKRRIRIRIEEKQPEHASQFLEILA